MDYMDLRQYWFNDGTVPGSCTLGKEKDLYCLCSR